MFLVGSPMANWSQARGQTKIGSKDLIKDDTRSEDTRPGGSPGSPLEPGPEGGLVDEHLVAGLATEPGRAHPEKATAPLI